MTLIDCRSGRFRDYRRPQVANRQPLIDCRTHDFFDRRTKAQLESARAIEQTRMDNAIEDYWRQKVAENIQRRMSLKVDELIATNPLLQRQAD